MKASKLLSILFFIIPVCSGVLAQSSVSPVALQKKYSNYEVSARGLSAANYFGQMSAEMHLTSDDEMILKSRYKPSENVIHLRYTQTYKGLSVIGNDYILHEKNNVITRANGRYSPDLNIDIHPKISVSNAVSVAEREFISIQKAGDHDNRISVPSLCVIDAIFPKISGISKLAYQIDIENHSGPAKRRYFIDAGNATIISSYSLIHEHNVPGTGVSRYYGIVPIVCDSIAPNEFMLRDNSRGGGIYVTDYAGTGYKGNSKHWDLHNDLRDEVAVDALYTSEQYYDMLLEEFNWNGVDGKGHPLNVILHKNDFGNVNAFWDGANANFGDGDCKNGPLTTFEVLGHEFTHGLVQFTSGLIYQDESGAINESIADMFGQALERRIEPEKFSWALGHSFQIDPTQIPFRIMDDPKSVGMPAYYKGEFWLDGNDVHYNSSIGNLWFVLLSDGKSGVTETGEPYDVIGIGIENALRVIFVANNGYNVPTTDYNELAANTLLAAEEIFGEGSPEAIAVQEAWKAVGVIGQVSTKARDLAITGKQNSMVTCDKVEFQPLSFIVTNLGSEPYDPSDEAVVALQGFNTPVRTIPLDEPILPGESKTFEVNDWMIYAGSQYETYNIDIINSLDENYDNNYDIFNMEYKDYPEGDLATYGFSFSGKACNESSVEVDAGYFNNSCEAIPAGTPVRYIMRNENNVIVYDETRELESELRPNSYRIIKIPITLEIEGEQGFSFYVGKENDPNLSNNSAIGYINANKAITTDYHQTFSLFPVQDGYLTIEDFSSIVPVDYQGELYVGMTGYSTDTTFSQHCFGPEAIFSNPESNVNSISACVDMSSQENSKVEFDLIFWRNEYFEHTKYPYSSMAQLSWEGNESGSVIILAEEDGIKKHFGYQLPGNFNGLVTLKMFTELGTLFLDESSYAVSDILLLDNFKINKGLLSKDKNPELEAITLYPNPANNIINFSTGNQQIVAAEIINAQGHSINKWSGINGQVDISELSSGAYFLKLITKDNGSVFKKFVKL